MARIRSIHPGLFTDEAFASLSMAARVMLIGIWTECDDQGVFEWKPISLKMKLFPADNIDADALLAELAAANVVMKFNLEDKPHGAVRNFCKFQKPKFPKFKTVTDHTVRKYVASSLDITEVSGGSSPPITEIGGVERDEFPQNGEIVSLMELEVGEGEEKKINLSPSPAKAGSGECARASFDDFWREYPRREGPNPRKPAETRFNALVKSGVDPDFLVSEVRKFAAIDDTRQKIGTRLIPQATTWLSQERWSDHAALKPAAVPESVSSKVHVKIDTPQWAAWTKHLGHPPMQDRNFGWFFATEWPPGHAPVSRETGT